MNTIHKDTIYRALLDINILRKVFCIFFPLVQIFDGISTVLALKANSAHYELNPLLNLFLQINGNVILTVMAYQIITLIIILSCILLFDLRNETYWKSEGVRQSLRVIYISSILLLVFWRVWFAVVPNLHLAFR